MRWRGADGFKYRRTTNWLHKNDLQQLFTVSPNINRKIQSKHVVALWQHQKKDQFFTEGDRLEKSGATS